MRLGILDRGEAIGIEDRLQRGLPGLVDDRRVDLDVGQARHDAALCAFREDVEHVAEVGVPERDGDAATSLLRLRLERQRTQWQRRGPAGKRAGPGRGVGNRHGRNRGRRCSAEVPGLERLGVPERDAHVTITTHERVLAVTVEVQHDPDDVRLEVTNADVRDTAAHDAVIELRGQLERGTCQVDDDAMRRGEREILHVDVAAESNDHLGAPRRAQHAHRRDRSSLRRAGGVRRAQ